MTDPPCAGKLDLFFSGVAADQAAAKAICAGCDQATRCFELGVAYGAQAGIWGGVDFANRRAVKRERQPPPQPQPRALAGCGTVAAYRRHLERGEPTCEPCRAANAAVTANRKARLRATAVA